jgi:GNAT superfamily N-acetyltransferase
LKLSNCSRDKFISSIDQSNPLDKFARTFVAKADMQDQWGYCIGAFDDAGELMGAIITTISKRRPYVANLQLLHTFARHRGKGSARLLCEDSLKRAISNFAIYFRVSSEKDSVGFYEHLGFKFWGSQKSGCSLSVFRIGGDTFLEGDYDLSDTTINKAVNRRGKGGCTTLYDLANTQNRVKIDDF